MDSTTAGPEDDCISGDSASASADSDSKFDVAVAIEQRSRCVCRGVREQASNASGDSVEDAVMVSELGVPGSRYGLIT